jgi:hypothetical protein
LVIPKRKALSEAPIRASPAARFVGKLAIREKLLIFFGFQTKISVASHFGF